MQLTQKKIVLVGGPGSGKTTVLAALKDKGYCCFEEISRAVTIEAQQKGIQQLFLTQPLLFSNMLLEGREKQFLKATNSNANVIFFDRGIPDIHAYLRYFNTDFPDTYVDKSQLYKYDIAFHFTPWEKIYTSDNERYETFEEAKLIDSFLTQTYKDLGYNLIEVPQNTIEKRVEFIENYLQNSL